MKKTIKTLITFIFAIVWGLAAPAWAALTTELANQGYRLTVSQDGDTVRTLLEDRILGLAVADGPCLYHAATREGKNALAADRLTNVSIRSEKQSLVIRGKLLDLDLEHRFTASKDRPALEERIVLKNNTGKMIALSDLEIGMQRQVADKEGRVTEGLAADRFAAVPFRYRAPNPRGSYHDYSLEDLVLKPGQITHLDELKYPFPVASPSRHRYSEGWAWTHAGNTLGIFSFSQENMLWSVVSRVELPDGKGLRIGGAAMIDGEPAALTRIAPGDCVDLGLICYQTVAGGYDAAAYAYRKMLDEHSCRFPADYNPPVHWEQLYDMNGAWDDRLHRYTRAIIEKQAALGREFSCEALYLDPGWDTAFGSFIWGEQWLGPRKQFIEEMQSKYGLKVSLHTPVATWISSFDAIGPMGPDAVSTFPSEARRMKPDMKNSDLQTVPAVRNGRRNMAMAPTVKPGASSNLPGYAIHQVAHLNDGWYGNNASWIPAQMPAWAEIDLGTKCRIGEVRLSNDSFSHLKDRAPTRQRILVTTEYNADSNAASWREVARYAGGGILESQSFVFSAVEARWVRVEITECEDDLPRLDEIEVYEAAETSPADAKAFAKAARRGPKPTSRPTGGPVLCLGSKQYLDVAAERMLANCADGVVFLMFDGNWWNGGCLDQNHGHAVPYRMEDHIRASLELARRVHAKYPKVLIEMHDMIAGGNNARLTPLYYKYGLPGSYDCNWGFELMWDVFKDIESGRALMLYYANMGCNVPIYLHINLAQDNENLLALWWYASTCRHLGIGGTHKDPKIVAAQQEAMRWYRAHESFYKRGDFYGANEEVHLHVLPKENAFVVNIFNLSEKTRIVTGEFDLKMAGLDAVVQYEGSKGWGKVENGVLRVRREMPAWSAEVAEFHEVPSTATALREATFWLEAKSQQLLRQSRVAMNNGATAFIPQAGGGYRAFWLRDYAYMLEGCPEAFTHEEMKSSLLTFVGGLNTNGASVDHVNFDGTIDYGSLASNPVADGSMFTVDVAWRTYQQTRDIALLKQVIDKLVQTMNAVPMDPIGNGLVYIDPNLPWDRMAWGFTDTVRQSGDTLMCSLLYVRACNQLAELLTAVGQGSHAASWRTAATMTTASIQSVFWNPSIGLFNAATVRCNQPDIMGSAFAVHIGVATPEQAAAIANYFNKNYDSLVVAGQIRHLPGRTYWQNRLESIAPETYQNGGYWGVATGWFAGTLAMVNPAKAGQMLVDAVNNYKTGSVYEWVNSAGKASGAGNYCASATMPLVLLKQLSPLPAQPVLVATGGTLDATTDIALSSNGGTAFAKDCISGHANHSIAHLNDGKYGNGHSWIGSANSTFCGVAFKQPSTISALAFGRDNESAGGLYNDRYAGMYVLQYTKTPNPDASTPDSAWTSFGALALDTDEATWGNGSGTYRRHLYKFNSITGVTGVRLLLDTATAAIAIDELEVYGASPQSKANDL